MEHRFNRIEQGRTLTGDWRPVPMLVMAINKATSCDKGATKSQGPGPSVWPEDLPALFAIAARLSVAKPRPQGLKYTYMVLE